MRSDRGSRNDRQRGVRGQRPSARCSRSSCVANETLSRGPAYPGLGGLSGLLITGGTAFVGRHLLDQLAAGVGFCDLSDFVIASRSLADVGHLVERIRWDVYDLELTEAELDAVIIGESIGVTMKGESKRGENSWLHRTLLPSGNHLTIKVP